MTTGKTIDPNAVIDAIARHFPDGFDYPDACDDWPLVIKRDLGLTGPEDHGFYLAIKRVVDALYEAGRLRLIRNDMALSHAEQARRVYVAIYGDDYDAKLDAADIAMVANVLAGKTEKKA